MSHKVLVINPGSTSTKIAVYDGDKQVFQKNVEHDAAKIAEFPTIAAQAPYRAPFVEKALEEQGIDLSTIDCIMCRGGMIIEPPITSGAYVVDDDLCTALASEDLCMAHGSLLGGLIGREFSDKLGKPAYIYDAVTSGSLPPIAKICGYTEFQRGSTAHVLNGRAQTIKYAESIGKKPEDLNVVVCHMGGGCSVMAFKHGELVDTIGDDELHMSAERAGGAQLVKFVKLCFSGKYTEKEVQKLVRGKGGLMAHLGTSNGKEIEERIEKGDTHAKEVLDAMSYTLCKSIGALVAIIGEKIDAIILTGGLAYSKHVSEFITNKVSFLAHVENMAGESEMEALAAGGIRLIEGTEKAKNYKLPAGYRK